MTQKDKEHTILNNDMNNEYYDNMSDKFKIDAVLSGCPVLFVLFCWVMFVCPIICFDNNNIKAISMGIGAF